GPDRLAGVIEDEPQLLPPELEVQGRVRQQDAKAGEPGIGLAARRAISAAAEGTSAPRADCAVQNARHARRPGRQGSAYHLTGARQMRGRDHSRAWTDS